MVRRSYKLDVRRTLAPEPFLTGSIGAWIFFIFMFYIVSFSIGDDHEADAKWIYSLLWGGLLSTSLIGFSSMIGRRATLSETSGRRRLFYGAVLVLHWVFVITPIHALALIHAPGWALPTGRLKSDAQLAARHALEAQLVRSQSKIERSAALLNYFNADRKHILVDRGTNLNLYMAHEFSSPDGRVKLVITHLRHGRVEHIQLDGSELLKLPGIVRGSEGRASRTEQTVVKLKRVAHEGHELKREAQERLASNALSVNGSGIREDWMSMLLESPAWNISTSFEGGRLYRVFCAFAAFMTGVLLAWTLQPVREMFQRWLRAGES